MYTTLQEAVQLNDQQKLMQAYQPCHKSLTAFCMKLLKDIEMAENVASDTFVKLLTYPKLAEIKDIRIWLIVTARNICLNHLKRVRLGQEIVDRHFSTVQAAPATGEANMMADSIDKIIHDCLDQREYQIWQLHQDGYHNREIAEMINSTEKTVANVKTMARKKLKMRLKAYA